MGGTLSASINHRVIMSDTSQFASTGLNPLSDANDEVDLSAVQIEHDEIRNAMITAGIEVVQVPSPLDCPDGVYTANWGLCIDDTVVFSRLPKQRELEELYVRELFETNKSLSKVYSRLIHPPYMFSGQGDALVCGGYIFCGQAYRSDPRMHAYLAELFPKMEVIPLQTVPVLNEDGSVEINSITGLPNSFFYDLDLALAIISPDTFAWCPEAFLPASQKVLRELTGFTKIEVSFDEAVSRFACNLVSTGKTVVMSSGAPLLQASLHELGYKTITPKIVQLAKGGGFIRCASLTI
jgi:N-dimethylarginine dimethylaminohydrolase